MSVTCLVGELSDTTAGQYDVQTTSITKGHNSKCCIVCKMLNFGQSLKAVLHLLNSCQLKLM